MGREAEAPAAWRSGEFYFGDLGSFALALTLYVVVEIRYLLHIVAGPSARTGALRANKKRATRSCGRQPASHTTCSRSTHLNGYPHGQHSGVSRDGEVTPAEKHDRTGLEAVLGKE